MKVALVHDFLTRLGGAERVLHAFAELYPEAPIHTLLYDKKNVGEIFPQDRVRTSSLQKLPRMVRNRAKYMLPFFPNAIEEFDFSEYDVVLSSSNAFAHGIVTNLETRHICYYHSPMRYAWDWTHSYLEEQELGSLKKKAAMKVLHNVRIWDFWASKRVDIALANSNNVQKRIQKYYRRESEVMYPPVDTKRFKVSQNAENYFVLVSQLTPYKRIDLAIELFNKTGERLVIIGDGPQRRELENMAEHNIDFLGFKDDETVTAYLENCRGFIFPGEEEFGIAPVEAMACGKPVLALRRGGLTETLVEGKTGAFFEESTVESMMEGFKMLVRNEPDYSPRAIRLHANKFSKEIFMDRMKRLVQNSRRHHRPLVSTPKSTLGAHVAIIH